MFTQGDECLARARAAAARLGLEMQSALVEYVDPLVYRGTMGIFRKYARFSFQSECRLALLPGDGAPFSLRLGSLSDICMIGDLHDIDRRIQVSHDNTGHPAQSSRPRLTVRAAIADCVR